MIIEGIYKITFEGSKAFVVAQTAVHELYGWRVINSRKEIEWPKFWKCKYHATLVKDIIVDEKHIIETPLTELK